MSKKKKYEVNYGSIISRKDNPFCIESGLMVSGGWLVELFEAYESWNSQHRSKKCRESRKSIKESIFEILYQIDKSMVLPQHNYQSMINDGVSEDDIKFDVNQIEESIEYVWGKFDRKSFEKVTN